VPGRSVPLEPQVARVSVKALKLELLVEAGVPGSVDNPGGELTVCPD
jgi:hypothetical protein